MAVSQRLACLLAWAVLSAGCGQKGPLYLEGREPRSHRAPIPKTPPPAPQEQAPARKEPAQKEQY